MPKIYIKISLKKHDFFFKVKYFQRQCWGWSTVVEGSPGSQEVLDSASPYRKNWPLWHMPVTPAPWWGGREDQKVNAFLKRLAYGITQTPVACGICGVRDPVFPISSMAMITTQHRDSRRMTKMWAPHRQQRMRQFIDADETKKHTHWAKGRE